MRRYPVPFALRAVALALVALGLLALPACRESAPTAPPATADARPPLPPAPPAPAAAGGGVELHSYAVPGGRVAEVRALLANVMSEGENPVGRVSVSPDGHLVVVAPPGIHEGVREVLARLSDLGPATPPPALRFTVWVVVGRPAAVGGRPRQLEEIAPALDSVTESQGPMEFRPLERLEVIAIQGEHARVVGMRVEVAVEASVAGDVVLARLNVADKTGRIDTRLRLKPGALAVLGQAGYRPGAPDDPFAPPTSLDAPPAGLSVFHVVRADVLE